MNPESIDELDLQLVADGYRVAVDSSAWDDLIETWDRKLTNLGLTRGSLPGEAHLKQQYGAIGRLLRQVGLPRGEDPIDHAVRSVEAPAMVITKRLRVAAINPAGRVRFGVEQGHIAHLDWLDTPFRDILRSHVEDSARSRNRRYSIMRTLLPDGRRGYAELLPIEVPGIAEPFCAVRELTLEWSGEMGRVLAEAFWLSEAEINTAQLLYLHADLAVVAEKRGVSIRTVRTQLGQIFAKTETSSQVELVRLLVLIGIRISAGPANVGLKWTDPLGHEQILVRKDGRRLAYTWMGSESGVPALFVPGIVNGFLYPDEFESVLKARGVKLYVLERPATGNSDPARDGDAFMDHVEAIIELCAHLKLDGILGVGIHAAVIPLTAAAVRENSPFSGLIGIGRFLPYTEQRYRLIPKLPRSLLWLSINAPWAADIVGQHGWRAIVQHGVDWYIERAYRDMPFDFQTTKNPEITTLMRNACAYTFLQSHDIFFDDMRMRRHDVRCYIERLSVPFHWMLGGVEVYGTSSDGGPFYKEGDFAEILALNRRVSFEKIDEAGELLPYQRPELVANRIADAALRCKDFLP